MDVVCRDIESGCILSVLRMHVLDLPIKLGQYFRQMVFDRIHGTWESETVLAVRIALLDQSRLSYFWMLSERTESGSSWLLDPDFVSAIPFRPYEQGQASEMTARTLRLLRSCCRDILRLPDASSPGGLEADTSDVYITFAHRTALDFLQAAEMQQLLDQVIN